MLASAWLVTLTSDLVRGSPCSAVFLYPQWEPGHIAGKMDETETLQHVWVGQGCSCLYPGVAHS